MRSPRRSFLRSRPVKVLHVLEGLYLYGGTPQKLLTQVQHRTAAVDYTFACLHEQGGLADEVRAAGASVIVTPRRHRLSLRHITDLTEVIEEASIDVVHTHFARANTYGRLAAIACRKPMIVSEHGLPRRGGAAMAILDSLLNVFTKANVCNSWATRRSVLRTVLLNRQNIRVIYNGVQDWPDDLEPRCAEGAETGRHGEGQIRVLAVGGFTSWRDHQTLVAGFAIARKQGLRGTLTLVGDGPRRAEVEAAVRENDLEGVVELRGYKGRGEVFKLMRKCDVFVNPAYAEGFGIATVEAMLAELPVVCASAGALPEYVLDRINGVLFSAGDTQELAERLLALGESAAWRARIGRRGRLTALRRFNVARFVEEFEALYLSAVAS